MTATERKKPGRSSQGKKIVRAIVSNIVLMNMCLLESHFSVAIIIILYLRIQSLFYICKSNLVQQRSHNFFFLPRYITPPQTLILVVSEAKQDRELASAIGLAEQVDPNGTRTMRLLTKFDTFDTQDAKNRAIKLVQDGVESCAHLGAHAVACSIQGARYCAAAEAGSFAAVGLAGARSGIAALKKRLPPIFAELIECNLDGVRSQVANRLNGAEQTLRQVGNEPADPERILAQCHKLLMDGFKKFEQNVTPLLKTFKEEIHKTEGKITEEWCGNHFVENAFECPFFSGGDAFTNCLKEIPTMWAPVLSKYMKAVKNVAMSVVESSVGPNSGLPARLQKEAARQWQGVFEKKVYSKFQKACEQALEKEADFGTINHYLEDRYEAGRTNTKEVADGIIQQIIQRDAASGYSLPSWRQDSEVAGSVTRENVDNHPFAKRIRKMVEDVLEG
jgi:hypothetical protein